MATHDYVIANDTAANVRSDINDALAAIVSNNSSATAPSTTYANQWWYDSTNDILKIRNEVDSAWINVLSLDQSGNTSTPYIGSSTYGVLDEDDMVSDSDTDLPTQQSVKAFAESLHAGGSRNAPSRSFATSYQNTRGKALLVCVTLSSTATAALLLQISADNSTWVAAHGQGVTSPNQVSFSVSVPQDFYYRVITTAGTGVVNSWSEFY